MWCKSCRLGTYLVWEFRDYAHTLGPAGVLEGFLSSQSQLSNAHDGMDPMSRTLQTLNPKLPEALNLNPKPSIRDWI